MIALFVYEISRLALIALSWQRIYVCSHYGSQPGTDLSERYIRPVEYNVPKIQYEGLPP
jgi:hypothetical protein